MRFRNLCFLVFLVSKILFSDECDDWFNRAKIKGDPDCLMKCMTLPSDLGTFTCNSHCNQFCDSRAIWEKILGSLAYYPGLTDKEKELVALHPTEAVKVFIQVQRAESATEAHFGRDAQDDESDAFRHFVWAALLSKEIGPALAKQFLDAHEYGQMHTASSIMDLANNRAGLLAAEKLKAAGALDQNAIEKEALLELKNKALKVLKPKGGPIK